MYFCENTIVFIVIVPNILGIVLKRIIVIYTFYNLKIYTFEKKLVKNVLEFKY